MYEYKVQACNSAGCSADSNTASVNVNNFARSITILYPNGGEIFTPGSTFSIKLAIPNDQSYGVKTFLMPQGSTPVNYSLPAGTSGVIINPVVGGYGFCDQALNYPVSQMNIGCDINSFYPAGTYKIRAYLLPRSVFDMDISSILNSAIAQDESDNVFSIAAATIETKPDLIIDDITIEKDTVTNPIPVYRYKVYVKNSGTADANKSSLRVTISPSQPQSIDNGADYTCPWGANFLIPNNDLVPGDILKTSQSERASDYFNPVAAGSVTITATADIYGAVNESNETNNTMAKTFSVEQLIDLGKCPNVCANNICIAVLSNEAIAKEQMAGILVSGVLKSTLDEAEKIKFKFTKFLQRGTRGNEVKKLQEFLRSYSDVYPDGLATGYFGLLTEAAVKRLQEKEGIEPLGIVGPKTRERLNKLMGLGI